MSLGNNRNLMDILSPKHTNYSRPHKKETGKATVLQPGTPSRKHGISLKYENVPTRESSPQKSTQRKTRYPVQPGFTIFEDKEYLRDVLDKQPAAEEQGIAIGKENENMHIVSSNPSELNHDDQENILQVKQQTRDLKQSHFLRRVPLSDLSIEDFPGYIKCDGSTNQLRELYQPANFQSLLNSVHRLNISLPSYTTPPRSRLHCDFVANRYLVKSRAKDVQSGLNDVENMLIHKSDLIRQRKRSYSVGKNERKLNLIKKNNFAIASS